MLAASCGSEQCVKALLEKPCDSTDQSDAVRVGFTECDCKPLSLSNMTVQRGLTALMIACKKKNFNIVQMLLAANKGVVSKASKVRLTNHHLLDLLRAAYFDRLSEWPYCSHVCGFSRR